MRLSINVIYNIIFICTFKNFKNLSFKTDPNNWVKAVLQIEKIMLF